MRTGAAGPAAPTHRNPGTGLAGRPGGRRGRRDGSGYSPVSPPQRVCHAAKCDPAARHTRLGRTAITNWTNDVSTRGPLQPGQDKPKRTSRTDVLSLLRRALPLAWVGSRPPGGISHSCHVKLSAAKKHDTARRHNPALKFLSELKGSGGDPVNGSRCVSLVSAPFRWRPPTLPSSPPTRPPSISQMRRDEPAIPTRQLAERLPDLAMSGCIQADRGNTSHLGLYQHHAVTPHRRTSGRCAGSNAAEAMRQRRRRGRQLRCGRARRELPRTTLQPSKSRRRSRLQAAQR